MDKVYGFFTGKRFILTIILLTVVAFFFSLFDRYIYIDDAWFGEQAYWFSKLGYVKTSSIIDFYGWDERLFVYHKLNIIIGAGLIKVFGWSPEPLRIFTLLVFLLFLFIVFKSLKSPALFSARVKSLPVFFFLIVNPLVLLFAFTFRPEILVMSLGFYSFLLLNGKETNLKILLSAALAGIALLVHLNGVIFIVAGFGLLLMRKRLKSALLFGFTATLVASLYFYDLWQPGHFDTFLYQIRHWPDDIASNYNTGGWFSFIIAALVKLSKEHQRFFWSPDVWGLSGAFVIAMVFKGRTLWTKHRDLLLYLLFAIIALNVLGSHIAEVSMLLLMPYMAIIAASFLSEIKINAKAWMQLTGIVLILFQTGTAATGLAETFEKKENTVEISAEMLAGFPENNEIVPVPFRFIFNQIPFRRLVSFKTMEYHQAKYGRKYTKEEFLALALRLGIRHMIVAPEMLSNNKMYPWMNEEFKDVEKGSFVKLKIEPGSNNLLRVE